MDFNCPHLLSSITQTLPPCEGPVLSPETKPRMQRRPAGRGSVVFVKVPVEDVPLVLLNAHSYAGVSEFVSIYNTCKIISFTQPFRKFSLSPGLP
jgi:hypothetical protein